VTGRDPRRRFASAWLLAGVCAGVASAVLAAPADDLRELRGRIEALQKELAHVEESRSEAADALKQSEQAISEANRKLFELGQSQREVNAALAELQAQTRQNQDKLGTQQALLARMLYQQYLAAQPESLKLLLNRDDPNQAARQLYYYGYLARARAEVVSGLRADLDRLSDLARRALDKRNELAAIEAEQVAQRTELQREKRARAQVLATISRQIVKQRREISTLKRDEDRLSRLVQQLARMLAPKKPPVLRNERVPDASADSGPFQRLKGKLHLPVRGELANRFGSPRSGGGVLWKGLFILAKTGQEVKAVAAGRVVYADWLRGFGNLLIIDHGDGYMTLYGNNESLLRRVGDAVRGGDAVAAVGASGGNSESGLYFELRHQGKPLDPLAWVLLE